MKLPLYLWASNRKQLPNGIILGTRRPYHVGQVWTYTNPDKYAEKLAQGNLLAYTVVPGHMIIIEYAGTIDGYVHILPGKDYQQEFKDVLQEMVGFYQEDRIEAKPSFYKQYKLPGL